MLLNNNKMVTPKTRKTCYLLAAGTGLAILLYSQFSTNPSQYSDGHYRSLTIGQTKKSYFGPKSIIAVINTPKMGTGGLFTTVTASHDCSTNNEALQSVNLLDCEGDRKAFRTHWFDAGSQTIQQHREEHPEGQCLIISAIRNPASWFASMFLQRGGGCNKDDWPTKEKLIRDFRTFLAKNGYFRPLKGALPDLMKEFNVVSLKEQAKIIEENGGYSMLGPATSESDLEGCELLLLSMDQSDRWPEIFEKIDPEIKFNRGASRLDQCPEYTEHIKVVADYKLSKEERFKIYTNEKHGGHFVEEWFDAYKYMDVTEE